MMLNRRGFLRGLLGTSALVAFYPLLPVPRPPVEGRLGFYRNIRFIQQNAIAPDEEGFYVAMVHPENSWVVKNGVGDYTVFWNPPIRGVLA